MSSWIEDRLEDATDFVSDVVETSVDVVEDVTEEVVDTVEKVGDIVVGIIEDPKKLAAVAIAVAFPGAGVAIGESLLGAEMAAAIGATATQVIGQTIINTAINGGDLEQGLMTAGVSVMTPALAKQISDNAVAQGIDKTLANAGAKVAAGTVTAAALGQDPLTAFTFGAVDQASNAILNQALSDSEFSKKYNALPDAAKVAVSASITSALTGADASTLAANQIVQRALATASKSINQQDAKEFTKQKLADSGVVLQDSELDKIASNLTDREQATQVVDRLTTKTTNEEQITKFLQDNGVTPTPELVTSFAKELGVKLDAPVEYDNLVKDPNVIPVGDTSSNAPQWLNLSQNEKITGTSKDEEGNQRVQIEATNIKDPSKTMSYTAVYDNVTGEVSYEYAYMDQTDPTKGVTVVSGKYPPLFPEEPTDETTSATKTESSESQPFVTPPSVEKPFDIAEEPIIRPESQTDSQPFKDLPSADLSSSAPSEEPIIQPPLQTDYQPLVAGPLADLSSSIPSEEPIIRPPLQTDDTDSKSDDTSTSTSVAPANNYEKELEDLRKQIEQQNLIAQEQSDALEKQRIADEEYKKQQAAQAAKAAQDARNQSWSNTLSTMSGIVPAATAALIDQSIPQAKAEFLTTKGGDTKFESPLAQFQQKVEGGSDFFDNSNISQGNDMNPYYSYGNETPVETILGLGGDQQVKPNENNPYFMAQGGMVAPLMAAQGGFTGTRHGKYAKGGVPSPLVASGGKMRVDFRHGDAVSGAGDGQSDDIPAMLADGEFVFPADVVAAIGNGSTKAGSDKLYDMMHSIRAHVRSAKPKELPPEIKSPLDFLKTSKKRRA